MGHLHDLGDSINKRTVLSTFCHATFITSTSVLLLVGPKCTLAASHGAPWWVTRRTDARPLLYAFR